MEINKNCCDSLILVLIVIIFLLMRVKILLIIFSMCAKLTDGGSDQDLRRAAVSTSGRVMDIDERQPPVTQPEAKKPTTVAPRRDDLPNTASSSNPSLANMINASINLDNPNIKQALDNLISSGPNIFKNISDTLAQKSSAAKYTDPSGQR